MCNAMENMVSQYLFFDLMQRRSNRIDLRQDVHPSRNLKPIHNPPTPHPRRGLRNASSAATPAISTEAAIGSGTSAGGEEDVVVGV